MDKQLVLAEIARIAARNGGKSPGRGLFAKESGIPMTAWYPHIWLRWGDALAEAGFAPNSLATAMDEDFIVSKHIELTKELGHLPVEGELRIKARKDPSFPTHSVFNRLGGKDALVARAVKYCEACSDMEAVAKIYRAYKPRAKLEEVDSKESIQGYVYMMRSGRRYKIGFTSSPVRRHREVRIELPEPTDLIHSIPTDDPRGIEQYWHNRFASKRVRDTEFFSLDASDVSAFKRRKYQ
jgi:hypothetical protein